MNVLSAGQFDTLAVTTNTISALSSFTLTTVANINKHSVVYTVIDSLPSDILIYNTTQSFLTVVENTDNEVSLEVTCSSSGLASITYSIEGLNGDAAPAWVTVSGAGTIKFTAPDVSATTEYEFIVRSSITGNDLVSSTNVIIRVNT